MTVRNRCPPDLSVQNAPNLISGQGETGCPYTFVFGHPNGGPNDA
jgi:hypothetical protein